MGALTVNADDYKAAVKKLNGAERAVKDNLRTRIWKAGQPLAEDVTRDGADGMPSRGGLQEWLRQSKGGLSMTQTRLSIQLSKGGKHDLAAINKGALRHPVYARQALSNREVTAVVNAAAAQAASAGRKLKGGKAAAKRKAKRTGWVWVSQDVPAGTYDKAFDKHADAALPEIAKVVDDVMRELQ